MKSTTLWQAAIRKWRWQNTAKIQTMRKADRMHVKQRLEKLERKTSLLRVVVAPPGDDIEKLRERLEAESRGPVVVLEADCERL
jgi:hypothetical protein